MNERSLKSIFGKFAGQEVKVLERTGKAKWGSIVYYEVDASDPVVNAMRDAAKKRGLILAVRLPNMASDAAFNFERVSAIVERDDAGKWRVQNEFRIG